MIKISRLLILASFLNILTSTSFAAAGAGGHDVPKTITIPAAALERIARDHLGKRNFYAGDHHLSGTTFISDGTEYSLLTLYFTSNRGDPKTAITLLQALDVFEKGKIQLTLHPGTKHPTWTGRFRFVDRHLLKKNYFVTGGVDAPPMDRNVSDLEIAVEDRSGMEIG